MDVLTSLAMHEGLKHLTMMQLMAFINQATFLRCNIQLAQPAAEPTDTAPLALPESIANFLAQSVGIPMENLPDCWHILKDFIWDIPSASQWAQIDEEAFRIHRWKIGVSE